MRLIELNTVLEEIEDTVTSVSFCGTVEAARSAHETKDRILSRVKDLPTVDAVPVTRCRDCVSSEYVIESNALPYYRCPYVSFDIRPDFYCAYGRERISDGRDRNPTDQD